MKTTALWPALVATALLVTLSSGAWAAQPTQSGRWHGGGEGFARGGFTVGEGKRYVKAFDFGVQPIQCDTSPDGETTPIELKFRGRLRIGPKGGFRGTLPDQITNEGAIAIRGRFVNPGKAVGTVSYFDRGCIGQNVLRWRATPATS